MTNSARIAVHLHLYYTEMWELMRSYLSHLQGTPYHLYVTLIEENPELTAQIKAFHGETTIWVVENRGYDVGPFIRFLHGIDLRDYDYIIKLHTKGNLPKGIHRVRDRYMGATWWRKLLFDALLGSAAQVRHNIALLDQNPAIGMVGSEYLLVHAKDDDEHIQAHLRDTLTRVGYPLAGFNTFFAGTIFMVRSSAMQVFKDHFSLSDFDITIKGCHDWTPAHMMERLFGILVQAQGYTLCGVGKKRSFDLILAWEALRRRAAQALLRFVYTRKVTRSNKLIIKVFKIPVWRVSLKNNQERS